MRFPPNGLMELVLMVALFFAVVTAIYAIQEAPGDRTRFTLERSEAPRLVGDRRLPMLAEETALGR